MELRIHGAGHTEVYHPKTKAEKQAIIDAHPDCAYSDGGECKRVERKHGFIWKLFHNTK